MLISALQKLSWIFTRDAELLSSVWNQVKTGCEKADDLI